MKSKLGYIWGIAVLLVAWQIGAWWAGDAIVVGPVTVMFKLIAESGTSRFWENVGASSLRIVAALFVAFVTAVPLGLFLGSSPRADRLAKPSDLSNVSRAKNRVSSPGAPGLWTG
jgi:NitT/TauT family transport system permease protein